MMPPRISTRRKISTVSFSLAPGSQCINFLREARATNLRARMKLAAAFAKTVLWLSVRHIAAFGNAVLEIIPLRLCIGSAARPLRRVGLDRHRRYLLHYPASKPKFAGAASS